VIKRCGHQYTTEDSRQRFKDDCAKYAGPTPRPAQMQLAADPSDVRGERSALLLRTVADFVDQCAPRTRLVVAQIECGFYRRQSVAQTPRLGRWPDLFVSVDNLSPVCQLIMRC